MDKYITEKGHKMLEDRLNALQEERPGILNDMIDARDIPGDDMIELTEAKRRLEEQDKKISDIGIALDTNKIFQKRLPENVEFGDMVEIEFDDGDVFTYKIVGTDEIIFWENSMSVASPLAQAIYGKKIGDEVEIELPSGFKTVLINKIDKMS